MIYTEQLNDQEVFSKIFNLKMSRAFIREGEDQWLSDIPPTVNALLNFLTRENNGIKIYEIKVENNSAGIEVHMMSNGLKYIKPAGHWEVLPL